MVYKHDTKYEWGNFAFGVDAQIAGKALSHIHKKHGKITPDLIVEYAKDRKSPIHSCFEWDDTKAAYQHRKQQARVFMCNVQIIKYHKNGIRDTRAFVSVVTDGDRSYQPTADVLSSDELRRQVIDGAKNNIKYWASELQKYKELAAIVQKMRGIEVDLNEFDLHRNKKTLRKEAVIQ